jgi:hypothetical protein
MFSFHRMRYHQHPIALVLSEQREDVMLGFRHARARRAGQALLSFVVTFGVVLGPQASATNAAETAASFPLYLPAVSNNYIAGVDYAIVFVSRQIPSDGSVYAEPDQTNGLPGVGPHSRFRPAAPGKLIVREPSGTLRVLIDGARPTSASLNLVDVNAPDVSYDGKTIVFAGLPKGNYDTDPGRNPGAWRIYKINVDGSNLRQVTFSDQNLSLSQFGVAAGGLSAYDDTDPVWLPDGRIVFSSTRWPSYAQYSGVRTSNLYVVGANGAGLHRITSERNGADRPLVDPVTGKIVYARWWRNHRFALNDMSTVVDADAPTFACAGAQYEQKDGLSALRGHEMDGASQYNDYLWRNAWQIATINPDGTGLAMWGGAFRNEAGNHMYGGSFTPNGDLIANFFPMYNMTEAAGFGGLRRYSRGPGSYTPIMGVTYTSGDVNDYVYTNPNSYGVYKSDYAAEPEVLPNGKMIVSWAPNHFQDYGLYIANLDGTKRTLLYNNPGTTELRAKAIRARPKPPILADAVPPPAVQLPPTSNPATFTQNGTFLFNALNVFFNAPVDVDIVSAPAIGSVASIRFFMDQQRISTGSFPGCDWPILLGEKTITASGAVSETAPAYVPLFEQLRSAVGGGVVPLTAGPTGNDGAAHVTGMNYGPTGAVAKCVGCHAGHTMIPIPADPQWTNLAPGAQVTVSSSRDPKYNRGLIDRRVMKGEIWRYWGSDPGQSRNGQWVRLEFAVPIKVRTVRLYNARFGDEANSTLQVTNATVALCGDIACASVIATKTVASNLSVSGTNVSFADVPNVRAVRVTLNNTTGKFYGMSITSLAEIEVIASGAP